MRFVIMESMALRVVFQYCYGDVPEFYKIFKRLFQFANYTFPISCHYLLINQLKYYAMKISS